MTPIAIFASAFHPSMGGVEELVAKLAKEYQRRGLEVLVVTNRWPRHLPQSELVGGVPVFRFPLRAPEPTMKARLSYALTQRTVRRQIASLLRSEDVGLIHVQCVSTNGHYADLAARDLGIPLVVTAQGERTMDADEIYSRSRFLNQTLARILDNANAVTACSGHTLADLEVWRDAAFGDRGHVVWNGVSIDELEDPDIQPYDHARPYVLALGRWVPQKGFDVLIRAFARAVDDVEFGHDLVLVGDGPERPHYERLVAELGVADRVTLHGRAARRQVVSLFKGCSYFVLPSRQEPFGIVNLEAMAAGKAVIATRVGGVPEFVEDGQAGVLVDAEDEVGLAEALRRVAADADLRHALEVGGRRLVDRFAWSEIADDYVRLYDEVLAGRVSRQGRAPSTSPGGNGGR
jgi:glycogen synthase